MSKLARIALVVGLSLLVSRSASATLIDLDDAADFAVLAMPSGSDTPDVDLFSSTDINAGSGTGHVGVGPDGDLDMFAGANVAGTIFLAPGVTPPSTIPPFCTRPGVVCDADLSGAINDALAASTLVAGLTPTQTFGTIDDDAIWNALAADSLNIISVDTIDLGATEVLELHGTASDYFLINVGTTFDLGGFSSIIASGGLLPNHVLFNFPTAGSLIGVSGNVDVVGTILAPQRDVQFHGRLESGAIFANDINFGSAGDLTHHPFERFQDQPDPDPDPTPVIPEPASVLLFGAGLLGAGRFARRSRS